MWRWFAGIRIAEEPSEPGYGGAYSHVTIAPYLLRPTDTSYSPATVFGAILGGSNFGPVLKMQEALRVCLQLDLGGI